MKSMYSMRSPAVKRLMKEAQELREPTELYYTQPLEDNLFEWHFTIRGPEDTDFDGGLYHGRIILPPEYPMKPPNVILLTPNGRFETNKKICLSISGHHPESWQPSWSIRTALLAIIGFMPTHGGGAIGSLDYPSEERKSLARRSSDWKCDHCGSVSTILKPVTEASKATKEEAKELATQINFRGEKSTAETKPAEESTSSSQNPTPIATPPNTPIFTNQTVPTMQMPGQFPFPAFPFSPFGNMPVFPQQQQQGSSFVPRFPYPPQFIPSMYPQMRMSFIVGNQNMGISSPFQTSGTVPTVALSQTSSSSEKSNVPNTSNSSNTTVIPNRDNVQISSTTASSTETINAEHDNNTSVNEPDTSSSLLRQRHTDTARQSNQQDNRYVGQYAELEPEPRQSGFRLSTLFIALLLLGITLLIMRRVYLHRMWRFPF